MTSIFEIDFTIREFNLFSNLNVGTIEEFMETPIEKIFSARFCTGVLIGKIMKKIADFKTKAKQDE